MTGFFDSEIHQSPAFVFLPRFSAVVYQGVIDGRIQCYSAARGSHEGTVLSSMMIRADEKYIWESCRDLLGRAVKDAAHVIHGVYRYDLLGFDIHREVSVFNFQELTALIVNHSRRMECGQQELIKYCSSYGMLKKVSAQDWGKSVFNANIDIFHEGEDKFDLYVKRFLTLDRNVREPITFVISDQSLHPVFDPGNEIQAQRLKKMLVKYLKKFEICPEIYLNDKNGSVELVSKVIDNNSS